MSCFPLFGFKRVIFRNIYSEGFNANPSVVQLIVSIGTVLRPGVRAQAKGWGGGGLAAAQKIS